jgi:hypothetical protein
VVQEVQALVVLGGLVGLQLLLQGHPVLVGQGVQGVAQVEMGLMVQVEIRQSVEVEVVEGEVKTLQIWMVLSVVLDQQQLLQQVGQVGQGEWVEVRH